jgi:hypothetical protein
MNETTKRFAIFVVAVCFMFCFFFVAVLYRNVGRFRSFHSSEGAARGAALDTHTGQLCLTVPQSDKSVPLCSDLAESWR